MKNHKSLNAARIALIGAALLATFGTSKTMAQAAQTVTTSPFNFVPGDLLVSSSTYSGTASTVTIGQSLPGGGTAVANGTFGPEGVFTNDTPDSSFGVTSPLTLSVINPTTGADIQDVNVTSLLSAAGDNLSTSFSSKSELALNLTPDGSGVTFMAYATTPNQLDISNSNTPGVVDSGNTDSATPTYRVVAQLNANGTIETTDTNAYPGNNGRAAVLGSNGQYYTVGNAGNGGSGPSTVVGVTGVQNVTPGANATTSSPNSVGSYNITQNGDAADKLAKDNNFRGETIFNNTLYVTKGSGSNGINTVYQVGNIGSLPTGSSNPISILPGFPTGLAKGSDPSHPFGLFFANASTLYVADEGDGVYGDVGTLANAAAGLEKWSLVGNTWQLDYTLQANLVGSSYTVDGSGPGGNYTSIADGLRNITGKVNADGTVTIYAVTSTVDNYANEDEGADPNQLVAITDTLSDTTASQASGEEYTTLETAAYGQVLRGVSFTPQAVPEPSTTAMLILALLGGAAFAWKRKNSLKA